MQTRPEILSFGPPDGPIGTRVTLLGVNLGGLTSVRMAGISAVFSILSDRIVNVIVPPGAPTSFIDVFAGELPARTATLFEVWPSACVVADPGLCPGSS